ncbi:hypothetical protein GBA65_07330 [Rubrobacter marinus]|uniref:Uncharacterized protein n=1 Tax=Rubrobacter marinus TaxID=2653852 RepID=A0A6G8PW18_9ACTN|nr:hypothetical protein [Rubrobacter marinus]QIN78365.1 hypothetical protein GBA65_07330 [Rubrobacter marinus]
MAIGWTAAVLAGIVISTLLRLLYGLLLGPEVERGSFTAAAVVVSLVAGFLSYLLGGYLAARSARYSGQKHGTLAAFAGLTVGIILTLILTPFEIVFAEGVALPPSCFGLTGDSVSAGLALFAINVFGALVGGTIGEPLHTDG